MLLAERDLVVLIPGFLGYEAVLNFEYFGAAMREQLATALRAVGIEPDICVAETFPAASLRERRRALVGYLAKRLRDRDRVHLIGHSTGGLDAYALATGLQRTNRNADQPLHDEIASRISTVITVASPMRGTSVVAAPEVRALRGWLFMPRSLRLFSPRVQRAILADPLTRDIGRALLREPWTSGSYVYELATRNQLIRDLHPRNVAEWIREPSADARPAFAHYVTVAAGSWDEVPPGGAAERELYARMIQLVHGGQRELSAEERERAWPAIAQRIARGEVIASGAGAERVREAGDTASDGAVDSALQYIREADIRGVIVGDHIDVIGHYDGARSRRGFIYSNSGFGGAEFDALWGSIAEVIAPRLEPTRAAPGKSRSLVGALRNALFGERDSRRAG